MARDNIKFTGGGVTVYIGTQSIKENYTNGIKVITIPTTNSTPNGSSFVNLNKMEDRFTVKGYLSNGKLGTETHTTALDKKNALKTMVALGSTIVMTWEGVEYDVGVDKYEIGYNSMDDKDNVQDGITIYDVTFSCIVGGDL